MKIFKLFISLFLILSISLINSIAAISVSDGSAFVTKAEFAADLNNLSNRMSSLENSLDAKIDSLVSSYLSRNGIWNGEKQVNEANILYVDISDGIWAASNLDGSYQYLFNPIKMYEKITKAGFFIFAGEWGIGSYFKNSTTTASTNQGYARIQKAGNFSSEYFGLDLQFGISKNGVLNSANFNPKASFQLGTQYRAYDKDGATSTEHRKFSCGAQIHYGSTSFFVEKDDMVSMRVIAYGNKRLTGVVWPEEVVNGFIGIRDYSATVY